MKSEVFNMKSPIRQYSTLFSCLYDEPEPIGFLGRGTHYSVFRTVEWLDVHRIPTQPCEIHDFSVIWDEDHDTRVINVIENIYASGLLSPIQFVGERKGTLSVIVASCFYYSGTPDITTYQQQLQRICNESSDGDYWPVEIGTFDRSPTSPHQTYTCGIISDTDHRVVTYLRNIDSLWRLGTKPYKAKASINLPPIPIPLPSQLDK